ncbi:uncharacterized protein si:ch211-67e16.4 isoform X4 [Toxotes jaculatrix]|uniref:uncharacterized protein si:ch211-67e16.4 isoform X4 n=1 Tax=Toxotes jaculatrix TaxID=941984 RepID=UPI001B3B19B0|nr:uncharacterized protein si:ch211-67e16.4 isoform X4 [Toxotes jaculatrix]
MDVSIAVSLIRGQMGTVVERAVNGAVETVLAEMLKVVGVKFEELKAQVALMKRDITALQREKALKEKENDNIRAKLRYTELKLKYYRQGVEEELQQRASASTLVRIHPSTFSQTQRGDASLSPTETSPSYSVQTRTAEGAPTRSSQERDTAESVGAVVAPPPIQAPSLDPGSPDVSTQADSSTLPSSAAQVKQEQLQQQEEVICIKEEPEEEQEVMATLLLDCQVKQGHLSESEAQSSVTEWSDLPASQRNHTATLSSAGPSTYLTVQPPASLPAMGNLPSGIPPRQAVRPWAKDLSLYEEYKLRRNELRRRSLNRRRELEKTLPQPLLADLVRERREKTRLRVARWRAKRKLQACLNQAQEWSCRSFSNCLSHQQPASGAQSIMCFHLHASAETELHTASVQQLPQQHVSSKRHVHLSPLHNLLLLLAAPERSQRDFTSAYCDINVVLLLPPGQPITAEYFSDGRRYLTVRFQNCEFAPRV